MKLTGRIPELDGIRGTAIALVLFHHLFIFPLVPGSFLSRFVIPLRLSWTGVDLFFVLSGFLIGGILLDARKAPNYFQVFYSRRFFRILPIYAAMLLIIPALAMVAGVLHLENYRWLGGNPLPWYSYWTFTQNFWMARTNVSGLMILVITWSLAIEEQFYLTLPVLIRFLNKKSLMAVVVSGILLAPSCGL
jgi:peptidoglycan/LPS O-acetylase OafA/YrhL